MYDELDKIKCPKYRFVFNDLKTQISKGKPPYVCTEDILYLSYQKKYISLNEACKLWNEMKSKRRILPKYDFKEVIRRFKINSNEKYNKQCKW